MIVAAGLTPAWQRILAFRRFALGEVNRADEAHACASGKAINVALAVRTLGGSVVLVSPSGGAVGRMLRESCAASNLAGRWIETSASTRVCTTVLDQAAAVATELVENAAPLTRWELEEYVAAVRDEAKRSQVLVLSGSLPAGTPATVNRDILVGYEGRAIVDARGEELRAAMPLRPFLIKPNREELSRTVGRPLPDETSVWNAMGEMNAAGATWVAVSAGPQATLVRSAEGRWRFHPPQATSVNPIGCGDCLAGGIAEALDRDVPPLEAIRWGMGAALDNLSQLLPARLDVARVQAFAERVRIEVA